MGRRKPVLTSKEKMLGLLALVVTLFFSTQIFDFKNQFYNNINDHEPDPSLEVTERIEMTTGREFPVEWMANVHDSMFHYTKNRNHSISSFGLNMAYKTLRHGLFVRVEDNKVFAKSKTLYQTPWEASFKSGVPDEFFCRIYSVICSLDRDTDIDFIYSHADEPVGSIHEPYPAFSWVKSDMSTDLLVPYGEAWGGALRKSDEQCDMESDGDSWDKRISKGVWRGANTGIQSDREWETAPRAQLVTTCNAFPDLCDAGFTQYVNGRVDQIQAMKNSLGTVDMLSKEEQDRYKYAIVPDGNSAPSSRMKSHLEAGSLIMKQKSEFKEFFYNSLQPFVHFLPLRADFQDLPDKIIWARNNDVLSLKMMHRAKKFSCKWFHDKSIHSYLMSVFDEYAKRFRGIKATTVNTADMTTIKINDLRQLEQTCGISRSDFKDKNCKLLTEF